MNFNIQRLFILLCFSVFLGSAGVGLWAAFDRQAGLLRFALLLTSVAPIFVAEVLPPERRLQSAPKVALFCLVLAYTIGIAYLAHANFRIGVLSGAVGSSLAVLLPLSVGAASWLSGRSSRLTVVGTLLSLCIIILALGVTRERTAWLSVVLGGLFALGIGANVEEGGRKAEFGRWPAARRIQEITPKITVAVLVLMIVGYLALFFPATERYLMRGLPAVLQAEIAERLVLWRNTLALIADYPFTGSGLEGLRMTLASYVYLTHTPVQRHAHQLFLQIAGEQGWPGAIAYIGLLLIAIVSTAEAVRSPNGGWRGLRMGILATLLSLLIYGLVDGEVYAYGTAPAAFLPIVCALLVRPTGTLVLPDWADSPSIADKDELSRLPTPPHLATLSPYHLSERGYWMQTTALAATVSLLSAGIILSWLHWDGLRSALWANLGAVAQSRAELSVYHWPAWGIQDELRRSEQVSLTDAVRDYQRALRLNLNNATALRRLGQIALSQGHYAEAKQALQAALRLSPTHQATHLLLGELYAIEGQPEAAVELWRSVPLVNGQLDGRYWWYYHLNAQREADYLYQAMLLLKAMD